MYIYFIKVEKLYEKYNEVQWKIHKKYNKKKKKTLKMEKLTQIVIIKKYQKMLSMYLSISNIGWFS